MAWTTPRTWKVGELPGTIGAHTALNTSLRDNLNFLYNPPRCRVLGSAIVVATATAYAVPMGTEAFDTDSMHSTSSNTHLVTLNTDGVYLIGADIEWDNPGVSGDIYTRIIETGGSSYIAGQAGPTANGIYIKHNISTIWKPRAAGQSVFLQVVQITGIGLALLASAGMSPCLWALWKGAP